MEDRDSMSRFVRLINQRHFNSDNLSHCARKCRAQCLPFCPSLSAFLLSAIIKSCIYLVLLEFEILKL